MFPDEDDLQSIVYTVVNEFLLHHFLHALHHKIWMDIITLYQVTEHLGSLDSTHLAGNAHDCAL